MAPRITVTVDYDLAAQGTPRPTGIPDVFDGRPTALDLGLPVQRYEDLYVTGDSVNAAMNRCAAGSVITFPEGVFQMPDFPKAAGYTSIIIPPKCAGIWGSKPMGARHGRDYTSTSGTIFQTTPMSSAQASYIDGMADWDVNQCRIMMQINSAGPATYGNFHVRGTDQPGGKVPTDPGGNSHDYNGFTAYNIAGPVNMQDVLTSGTQASGMHPPGETFNLSFHAHPSYSKIPFMAARVEVDGRRYTDGNMHGGLGTCQNYDKGTWVDYYGHHARTSSSVVWQCTNIDWFDCRSEWNGVAGSGQRNGHPFNIERGNNIRYIRPSALIDTSKGSGSPHFTFSNDTWNSKGYGAQGNGQLYIEEPTYNSTIYGSGLYVQTWTPYSNGDKQTSIPVVVHSDGTPLGSALHYIHGADAQN